jgi:hypothetical protein
LASKKLPEQGQQQFQEELRPCNLNFTTKKKIKHLS